VSRNGHPFSPQRGVGGGHHHQPVHERGGGAAASSSMLVVVNVPAAAATGTSEAILDNVSDISEGDIPELAEAEEEDEEMAEPPPTAAAAQPASVVVDMDTTTAATSFVDMSTTAIAATRSITISKATNGHDASSGGAPQDGGGANAGRTTAERVSVVRTSTMSAILTARGAAAATGMSREDIEEISDEEAEWSDDVETAGYGDFEPMDLLLSSMSGSGDGGDNMAELQTVRVLDAAAVGGWDLKPLTALCSPTETLFDAVSRGKAVVDRPQGGGVVEADMMMEQQKAAGPSLAELLARLTATAAAAGDERWVDSIEAAAALLQEELPALLLKNGRGVTSSSLVEVSLLGLDYKAGACLPRPAHQVRHVKAGLRFLLEALSCDDDTFDSLIGSDVQQQLLALYGQPFMTVPTKLLVLRVLDRTLDRASGMAGALRSGDVNYRSVYEQLLDLLKEETKTRIKFALKSIVNKFHLYEMLMRLSELAACLQQSSFGEIEHLLRQLAATYSSLDTAMSHPARFLPCSQQWELDPAAQAADSRPERGYFALADQAGLLAALVALLTAADTQHSSGLAAAIQDLLQLWLDTEAGLMYLAAGGPATSALIRALLDTEVTTQTTTTVKGAITSEDGTPTTTTTAGTVLGLELAAMMQATQQVDVLTAAVRAAAERQDMEARPVLAAVQLLYGLTASGPGKRAVVHVLTLGRHLEAGLEKTRVLKKKTSPVGFFGFFFGFLGFFGFFCPDERVFRVFSVSRTLSLNYYHSY
jgi:hypothetical protein